MRGAARARAGTPDGGIPAFGGDQAGGATGRAASGSSARQTVATEGKPVDAVVMAIVDSWDIDGEERYRKGDE